MLYLTVLASGLALAADYAAFQTAVQHKNSAHSLNKDWQKTKVDYKTRYATQLAQVDRN